LTKKDTKRKRRLRQAGLVHSHNERSVERMLQAFK
jgi:ribosomal protein L35